MEDLRYSILIQWDDENGVYMITLPEFPGSHTHGDTYEEALQNGKEMLKLLIETHQSLGESLPEPHRYDSSEKSSWTG